MLSNNESSLTKNPKIEREVPSSAKFSIEVNSATEIKDADELRMRCNDQENFLDLDGVKMHVTVDKDNDTIMLHPLNLAKYLEGETLTITNAKSGGSKEVVIKNGDAVFKLSEIRSSIEHLKDVEVSLK